MKSVFSKRRGTYIISAAVVIVMLVITWLAYQEEGAGADWYLPCAIGAAVLAGFLVTIRLPFKIYNIIRNLILITGVPFAAILLVQNFTLNPLGEKGIYPMMLLANAVFYYLLYLLAAFIFGSFRIGYGIMSFVFLFLGTLNYFVVQFRSSPIVPWDIYSIGTAASVADNYTYSISWRFLATVYGWIFLMILIRKITWKCRPIPVRIVGTVLMAAGLLLSVDRLQQKEVKDWLGMDQTLFTPNVRYRNNGFLAAFLGNLHLIAVQQPQGYSTAKVSQLSSELEALREEQGRVSVRDFDPAAAPNIIIVMDEAFSDLAVRGDFSVSEDYMPFFRSMMEEQAGGYLLVSVKGGNTANTEYEFFSGDSMAFLPAGSVVYQQFIRDNIPALPSQLASLGYSTTAIHPYLATGWERNRVYELLGFQEFLAIDDFVKPLYLRNYVSDQSAFDKIIEEYEAKRKANPDEPQFIFEVTMQNHSGYSKDYPGFSEQIFLTSISKSNTQTRAAEKYLTLIYESDKALRDLVDYFEQSGEPTIIVAFGDHQPSDYVTNVIDRITKYNPDSEDLEEAQKSFLVPYFIWNNCGLDIDAGELSSVNYLASVILEAAGIPMTPYQSWLLDQKEILPAIAGGAYVDTQGNYHSYDEKNSEYGSLLNTYNILQYNHMTDISHRNSSLFQLGFTK